MDRIRASAKMAWTSLLGARRVLGGSFLVILVALSPPVAALQPSVSTEFLNSVDISGFEACVWREGHPTANFDIEATIRQTVNNELLKKGYAVTEGEGDCWVRSGGAKGGNLPIGILVVEVFDAETAQLAWRGKAVGVADFKPKQGRKIVAKAVKRMFRDFPRAR